MTVDEQIINDLMTKCADDVVRALKRTLSITPDPQLPVATAAGVACIGVIAGILEHMAGNRVAGSAPDPECVLLAGLICARMGMDPRDGIAQAYRDLEVLKAHTVT